MKPVLRVAALMETPVKFIWTHDAFRVGEDGPTHQPIEQEAQLRLLEKLNNHSGNPSFVALRPADGPETVATWRIMLECKDRPAGLILSRQNIDDIPPIEYSRLEEAMAAYSGAYLVLDCEGEPDVVLIGNGSEVSTLYAGAQRLIENHNLNVRVVSVPSEGIFRQQSKNYQTAIIPSDVPTFGMTAGLPVTLEGLMNTSYRIHGMTHFGYSAPYKVLDVKFGYTGENVEKQVLALLGQ
jgi:transketolase